MIASFSYGQTTPASQTSKIGWDQEAVTLADAQGYIYKYYADSYAIGVVLNNVTCTGTVSPFQCQVAFPAFTPGEHNLTLTAENLAGVSPPSNVLSFKFVVTPSAPGNVRIIIKGGGDE